MMHRVNFLKVDPLETHDSCLLLSSNAFEQFHLRGNWLPNVLLSQIYPNLLFFLFFPDMSELQAALEIQVELSKFYNVDLFQRG